MQRPVPLVTSIDSLVPHEDRDHFVFSWQRLVDGNLVASGMQVEHISAASDGNDFEVTLSEDGIASGKVHIRVAGASMAVVSEDDLSHGVRVTYQPPLPYLEAPLFAGEKLTTVAANVSDLDDPSQAFGVLKVTQRQTFAPAGPIQTNMGMRQDGISIHTTRTIEGGGDTMQITTQVVLVPGLGEVRSESSSPQAATLRRQLGCAIIKGQSFGDCQRLRLRRRD